MEEYRTDGVVIADEFGTFFIESKALSQKWIDDKKYVPIVDGYNLFLRNKTSIMFPVKTGQPEASEFAKNLYDSVIGV